MKPRQALPTQGNLVHGDLDARENQARRNKRDCISRDADGQILATSAPVLAHPMAQRIPISLRHLDSENTNSVAADVGVAIPNVPPSQKNDNDRWRIWLQEPPSVTNTHRIPKKNHHLMQHQITPGVSEMPQPRDSSPAFLPPMEGRTPCPTRGVVPDAQHVTQFSSSSDTSIILARYDELKRRIYESQSQEHEAHFGDNSEDAEMEQQGMAEKDIVFEETEASNHETGFDHHTAFEADRNDGELIEPRSGDHHINPMVWPEMSAPKGNSAMPPPQTLIRNVEARRDHCNMSSKEPKLNRRAVVRPDYVEPKQSDAVEAWRTFVFGDENSDELESAAFAKATYDAAQHYRPFNRSKLMQESEGDGAFRTTGLRAPPEGSASANFRPRTDSPDTTAPVPDIDVNISPTENDFNDICPDYPELADIVETARGMGLRAKSPSLLVHVSSSDFADQHDDWLGPPDILESVEIMESHLTSPTLMVNISSADSMVADKSHCSVPAGIVESTGRVPSQPKGPSASLAIPIAPEYGSEVEVNQRQVHVPEQPQPRGTGAPREQLRFARPKLFVGSRSNPQPEHRPTVKIGRTRGRGRTKKRASDGRADIRAFPNYTSDPIEEFEEPGQSRQALFPPLEFA
ncbi:hypothetical protein QBC44DRAFT_366901 [Cladorrhinum sp. PSN332]|nr:hypothetical protein QBC44DRAFT_366901 [Cladorrhinum sp. PSN332]